MARDRNDALRPQPYVWPSWISKHIAKESKCWYAPWFKATHFYKKVLDPSREAFLAEWTKTHDAMVNQRAAQMKADDWTVRVEDEGEFKLEGKAATLAGKPDIVGQREGYALIIDAKSGKARESDHWQVRTYMFAIPLCWLSGHKSLHGEVQYQDRAVAVEFEERHVERIAEAIRKIADVAHPPEAVPSSFECGRCDLAACKVRHVKPKPGDARRFF